MPEKMKVEKRKKVYITLTKEEKDIFDEASTLIADICDNMYSDDELAFIDEDAIRDLFTKNELRNIAASLFNMTEFRLEII